MNTTSPNFLTKIFNCLLLLLSAILLSGCVPLIVAGAGAGAFSYYSGNLVRMYEADYNHAVRVSSKVMKQLGFNVTGKKGDGLKTVLTAERADKTPVTITVEQTEDSYLRIGVRNGPIGISNLKASELVHNHIAQQLTQRQIQNKQPDPEQIKKIIVNQPKIRRPVDAKQNTSSDNHPNVDFESSAANENTPPEPSLIVPSAVDGGDSIESSPELLTVVDDVKSEDSISEEPPDNDENDLAISDPSISDTTVNIAPHAEASRTSPFFRSTYYIYYKKEEKTIPVAGFEILDKVTDYMKENPDASLEIRAYTDSTDDPAASLEISKSRALSIRDYFEEKGVNLEKMTAEGHGASNFLENNRTESLRAINRRVELRVF